MDVRSADAGAKQYKPAKPSSRTQKGVFRPVRQALVNAIVRECQGTHRAVIHRQRLGHRLDIWHGFVLLWANCLLVLDRRDDLHQERHREGLLNTNVFCATLGLKCRANNLWMNATYRSSGPLGSFAYADNPL